MIKTKDTGYLFAKMSSEENGVSHIVVDEQKGAKSRTYNFEESGTAEKQQTLGRWLLDNVMLLVTLIGVLTGVITGA